MNWEWERHFVDLNSRLGDKFGIGVTSSISTPVNTSVQGIIFVDGSLSTFASFSGANHGGWSNRILWEKKFCIYWLF